MTLKLRSNLLTDIPRKVGGLFQRHHRTNRKKLIKVCYFEARITKFIQRSSLHCCTPVRHKDREFNNTWKILFLTRVEPSLLLRSRFLHLYF